MGEEPAERIFISYRRADTPPAARGTALAELDLKSNSLRI